jgi:hypothetical protein
VTTSRRFAIDRGKVQSMVKQPHPISLRLNAAEVTARAREILLVSENR